MWAYIIGLLAIMLGLVGAVAGAGIFTLILVPIGIVIVVAGTITALIARRKAGDAGAGTTASQTTDRPLPHSPRRPPGREPTRPEDLVDARRAQQ